MFLIKKPKQEIDAQKLKAEATERIVQDSRDFSKMVQNEIKTYENQPKIT